MRNRTIFRSLSALLLLVSMTGCDAAKRPDLAPPPTSAVTRLVYQPIDGGLLTCRKAPALPEDPTDFDATAMLAGIYDAWEDCFLKLQKIRERQAPVKGPAASQTP